MWAAEEVINTGLHRSLCRRLDARHGALPHGLGGDGGGGDVREDGGGEDPRVHDESIHHGPAEGEHSLLHAAHHAKVLGGHCRLWEVRGHVGPACAGLDAVPQERHGRQDVGGAKAFIYGGRERDIASVSWENSET